MSDVRPGGRRRIDRVLAPEFASGLEDLDDDEVRRRRDLCRAEREYLSFLRRLVQGRLDILSAERERRRAGGEPPPLVERLAEILAEGTRGPSRGEAPVVTLPEAEVSLARRQLDRVVSDVALSKPEGLSDEQLDEAIEGLGAEERSISETRRRVLQADDALQAEVARRYRAGAGRGAS
jgi:hypothetical protein